MNAHGRVLVKVANANDLYLLNDISPTFIRDTRYSSCLDLAFVFQLLLPQSKGFLDVEMHGSDHTHWNFQFYDVEATTSIQEHELDNFPGFSGSSSHIVARCIHN